VDYFYFSMLCMHVLVVNSRACVHQRAAVSDYQKFAASPANTRLARGRGCIAFYHESRLTVDCPTDTVPYSCATSPSTFQPRSPR